MMLAVIPARGGSKRIPGKNIRSFCGKPIIQYSIDAAFNAEVFDRVVVSTDSDEIAAVAVECGAEVPFVRPKQISDDHTPLIPVMRHAIDTLTTSDNPIEFACSIYATAPFVLPSDIKVGLQKLKLDRTVDFAFPVTTFPFTIFRSLRMENEIVRMFYPEHEFSRSQDLPEAWHDAGQFHWGSVTAWRSASGVFSGKSIGIPISRHRVQDIDTPEDWARAESMFEALNRGADA